IPVIGAFFLPLLGRISAKARNISALLLAVIPMCVSAKVLQLAIKEPLVFNIVFPYGFDFTLRADGLAAFMALVSTSISAIILLYSFGYIRKYPNQNEYYFMVVLFLGSMMGLIFSSNLILLYLFWEMTALASWRLIGFFRGEKEIYRANKAFLVTVFGALLMLLGFLILYGQTGSFDLLTIKSALADKPVSNLAVLLILAGIFSKSATLPFHTWLPDAGVAPSPVTALLHAAILVKIGVYVFARLFVATIPLSVFWQVGVPVIAAVSALVSAGAALIDTDIKRIIAYSTISQIGFIFLGLSVSSEVGIAGALLYIFMHGLSKAGLFLCAGIVEQNTHEKNIRKLGGLVSAMPITASAFLLCAFSVMGIPPFGGFFCKYMVITGAVMSGHPAIAITFFVGAILTVLYLFRLYNAVFMGEMKCNHVSEGSVTMLIAVAALAALSLLGGLFINYPAELVQTILSQIAVVAK
ncbi:MAG TPA: NADH-quinone oxidoreductase subunit L, partial [Candidatus Omnitrophota bacterium]|nr:NADH-quinone oxidoreductase subunit L [Candidatus Omnitrophota bacterium]